MGDYFLKTGTIYIIKNTINDKVYIGQTTMSVHERWKAHLKPSTHKLKGKYKLYNAMNKYGKENFYYEILEENVPIDELNQREIDYIAQYDSYFNGYNSTKGGDGRYFNNDLDCETIEKLYLDGVSTVKLGEIYGVHGITICRTLRSRGIKLRVDRRKLTDEQFPEIKELLQTHSYREVAEKYNVHTRTVSRFASKHGFRKRVK